MMGDDGHDGYEERRMGLQGIGIWSAHLRYGDGGAIAEAAAELEELGYQAMWVPDVGGDVLDAVERLLESTTGIGVATGILNIWMQDPTVVARRRAAWNGTWQERFTMGLGVSHAPLIDHEHPGRYTKPYSKMVEFLDALDAAPEPFPVTSRVLAALRPRMLRLARDRAAGVHPYFVPPEHVARARDILGPEATIAVEQAVVLDADPTSARTTARRHTTTYVNLPNYTNNLREFGFGDDDFTDGGSDRLVDAIVAWGDDDAIARRVTAMFDAGANHVCLQAIRPDDEMPRDDWRHLAGLLLQT
jgi:probable F420-dependent oxidoreductase